MSTGNRNVPGPGPGPYRDNDAAWGCGWAALWFWLFLFVLFFAGWGWWGWYGGWGGPWGWWEPRVVNPPQANAPAHNAPTNTTAQQLAASGGEFVGRKVTLSGKVDQIFNPRVFTLASPKGGRQLVVVTHDGKAWTVKPGETVHITGMVEKFEPKQLHNETGADLSKVPKADYDGRPAVIASSINTKGGPG